MEKNTIVTRKESHQQVCVFRCAAPHGEEKRETNETNESRTLLACCTVGRSVAKQQRGVLGGGRRRPNCSQSVCVMVIVDYFRGGAQSFDFQKPVKTCKTSDITSLDQVTIVTSP